MHGRANGRRRLIRINAAARHSRLSLGRRRGKKEQHSPIEVRLAIELDEKQDDPREASDPQQGAIRPIDLFLGVSFTRRENPARCFCARSIGSGLGSIEAM
jgi:hypothetical protein